jgi:diguanylate cyclase (GGDEF)-like protein
MSVLTSKAKRFVMRNRVTLQDILLVVLAVFVTAYLLLEIDVFVAPGGVALDHTIELDELPILGGVLCFSLLVFSWRRLKVQQRETAARIDAQAHLSQMAYQDPLTGLPNRRRLREALEIAVESPPAAGTVHALISLDLNGFKRINDLFGHGTGDQSLIIVSQRLLSAVRDGDLVARLGGDEFSILATQLPGSENATSLALRILEQFLSPLLIDGVEHRVGAGIGVCLLPYFGATADETMRRADVALYKAKREENAAIRFFDEQMDGQARGRRMLETAFREAFATGQITPYFQPLIDLKTREVVGFELLARWTHLTMGAVPPERFIAVAEDIGMIGALTDHLLRAACEAACEWPASTFLSVNISAVELGDPTLGPRILSILKQTGMASERLELEITEAALRQDLDAARTVLPMLREAGVSIALDDFGTGYSSLYHLRAFKVDKIKIDRSFVHNMTSEKASAEIVAALIGLGRGLGLEITAEGIEDTQAQTVLSSMGCQQGQGVLFSNAVSAREALVLVGTGLQRKPRLLPI